MFYLMQKYIIAVESNKINTFFDFFRKITVGVPFDPPIRRRSTAHRQIYYNVAEGGALRVRCAAQKSQKSVL